QLCDERRARLPAADNDDPIRHRSLPVPRGCLAPPCAVCKRSAATDPVPRTAPNEKPLPPARGERGNEGQSPRRQPAVRSGVLPSGSCDRPPGGRVSSASLSSATLTRTTPPLASLPNSSSSA